MESIKKLIVITSANNPEYANFWGLSDNIEHAIIKNGQTRGKWKVFGFKNAELKQKLQNNIDENCLIMIHQNMPNNFQEMEFEKGGKLINCYIYYYSKQDPNLNGVLWTIDEGYRYQGGPDPKYPFDKLRMSIVKNEEQKKKESEDRIRESVTEIIKWVKEKTTTQNLLNIKLDLLHRCLNQETAKDAIKSMEDYGDVKQIEVKNGVSVNDFIYNNLLKADKDQYNNQLTVLRDALLNEEVFGSV
jgi:hypothetical protein